MLFAVGRVFYYRDIFAYILYVIGLLQCVKQYIEVQIDDNQAASITCPDPDCRRHGVIDAAEVTFIFISHCICIVCWFDNSYKE